ncbi:AraC family transcriptional regulator [Paenibacillus alkalitolerans]|uniref:AraC family transcriptional regulator n=1 Tax=Paenibacillus alkalitolerans TaxID=2799335 RepID=UPI0018F35F86|nr:AraC family transcriptional regulator [Paenibacillus alkalitolerans]
MKILNYLNLYRHPVYLSFMRDRTRDFVDIYHAHQGMELLYVHEGQGQVIVNQQIFELTPGSLFYFRPFQLHRINMKLVPDSRYIRTLFVFEPSVLERYVAPFASLRTFFHRICQEPLDQPQVLFGLPQQKIHRLLEDYQERMEETSEEHRLEEQMLFLIAFLHLLKAHEGPRQRKHPPQVRKSSVAERVMKWVENHYMEEFALKQIADEVHLTPNYVSAVFRQEVGTSITEYLTARRIRQACWLLKTSDLPVQEIGRMVGLTNNSYFCNLFKKQVGLSPYRYRRSNDKKLQGS